MLRSPKSLLVWLPLAVVLGASPALAASPEAQVKAAYLYKLASFVRWPESARQGDSVRLCIVGRSDITAVLQTLVRGQRIDGKPVEIRTVGSGNVEDARTCHVLYLGSGPETARKLAAATQGLPVLTIGDRTSRTDSRVIDFIQRDGKVRFVVDTGAARARGLEVSSKLLEVAEAVE